MLTVQEITSAFVQRYSRYPKLIESEIGMILDFMCIDGVYADEDDILDCMLYSESSYQ